MKKCVSLLFGKQEHMYTVFGTKETVKNFKGKDKKAPTD